MRIQLLELKAKDWKSDTQQAILSVSPKPDTICVVRDFGDGTRAWLLAGMGMTSAVHDIHCDE